MGRFQQLWNDSKTGDILKSGICKDTVTQLVREITAITDIRALDQSFCCELQKKFRVPLPNIRTLVSQAKFYLKHREEAQLGAGTSSMPSPESEDSVTYLSSDSRDCIQPQTMAEDSPLQEMEQDSEDEEEPGENENTWEVIDILTHVIKDGVKSYRVQWKTDDRGEYWSDEENWVEESLMKCPDLVEKYEANLRDELKIRKAVLSKEDLKAKRLREMKEKTKLQIADDSDICTLSEDSDTKQRKREHSKKVEKPKTRRKACYVNSSSSSSEDECSESISPRAVAADKPSTSKTCLKTKRLLEMTEKTKLRIADDKDICTFSDDAADNAKPKKRMRLGIVEKPKTRRKACYDKSSSSSDEEISDDMDEPSTSKRRTRAATLGKKGTPKRTSIMNEVQRNRDLSLQEETDGSEPSVELDEESAPASSVLEYEQEDVNMVHSPTLSDAEVVVGEPILSMDELVAEQHVLDTTISSWTENWYSQAERKEVKALERSLEPHQCILYQKNTDPNGYGRCLFVFLDDNELVADWIHFPFPGEHKDLMRQLLNSYLESMQEMGLAFNLQVNKERDHFEKMRSSFE